MNKNQLNKLSVLYNNCAHNILGIHSYRFNLPTIYKKLNWTSFSQLIIMESLKIIREMCNFSRYAVCSVHGFICKLILLIFVTQKVQLLFC